ncbi:MAG: heme-binding domain-containing protein [Hyphomicrobiales bacterium]
MKNNISTIIVIIIIILVIIQFIPVDFHPADFDKNDDLFVAVDAPKEVSTLFHDACYDCHSFETDFPWYSKVAPVSWWLKKHITTGRENLNFSIWTSYNKGQKLAAYGEIIEVVETKRMPLKSYTWMHPKARLTDDQRSEMSSWATQQEQALAK